MSLRQIGIVLVCLTLSWAIGVDRANGQQHPKEKAIQHRLRQPISLHFKDFPLKQVIKDMSVASGIEIVPDVVELEKGRINMDALLSISVEGVEMKMALQYLLRPLNLTFVIEDQVLKITPEDRPGRLVRVTFPVADLVHPSPTIEGQEPTGPTIEKTLMELITNTIAKDSWDSMGGRGSMQYFVKGKALVVNQTQEVQEEVQLLLATLRKLYDLSVSVEVRFVQTSAETSERLRKEMAQHGKTIGPDDRMAKMVSFEDSRVRAFLEVAQGQRATTIVQAPRLNICNGQRLNLECLHKQIVQTEFRAPKEEPAVIAAVAKAIKEAPMVLAKAESVRSGVRYDVKPVVTPDRRSVRLDLNVEHFANEDGVKRITSASCVRQVNDGCTLVWHLGEIAGREHLFVLVTPRIRVREEPEEVFLGPMLPIPGR